MQLALGTVQFGLAYGVANAAGKVSEDHARAILAHAWQSGIRRLDTAAAYGDIEERLADLCDGHDFEIVSKIPSISSDLSDAAATALALKSVETSKARLGERLCGILFHDASNLAGARGSALWNAVSALATELGLKLGSSGYAPSNIEQVRMLPHFAMTQLPGNVLDQRVLAHPQLLAETETTIRSALLQGLLLLDDDQVAARVPAALGAVQQWRAFCEQHGLPLLQAAFSVVKGFKDAAFCVIGVDSVEQLSANVDAWAKAHPISASTLATSAPAIIDPRLWPALNG
jgi:aryl-alcohol dehydrogenase-like predicted oxidoreductase